ncbi:MAG: hypothetical protein ACQGVK_15520 [Myxococcota bacterium]
MARSAGPVASLVALLSAGCVTFSDLPRPVPRNPGAPVVEQVRVFVDDGYDPIEQTGLFTPYPVKSHQDWALQTFRESGWARRVDLVDQPEVADLVLRVERYQSWAGTLLLTTITFGLFPSYFERSLKVKWTRRGSDRMARSCVRVQRYTQWVELFLLPFMVNHSLGPYERLAVARMTARCGREIFGPRAASAGLGDRAASARRDR